MSVGALGCLRWSLDRVSAVSAAIGSSEDNSRIAPFMFFSANLASILFFKISVSGFGLGFFFLKGKGNPSGGKFELRKVDIWFFILVTREGLLILGLSFSGFFRQWKEKQSSLDQAEEVLESIASQISWFRAFAAWILAPRGMLPRTETFSLQRSK